MKSLINSSSVKNKGRISVFQISLLLITFVISTADVFLPKFVAQEAKQDAWIAVILGTIMALVYINLFLILGLKYPNKTIIQYSTDILGKPLGKFVGFLYFYMYFYIAYGVTRQLGEIFAISFIPRAPATGYAIVTTIVAAYAVYKGLEVIARLNQLMLPLGLGALLFIALINLPEMDVSNFLPILYNGVYPSIKGSLLIQAWLLETIVILQFIPYIKEKHLIRTSVNISTIILGLSLQIGTLTIGVFGTLTEFFLFPALQYVRYASIGEYIHNLDIVLVVVWIAGIFIKIALAFYAAVHSLAQLTGAKSYKYYIFPLGVLLVVLSQIGARNIPELLQILHYTFPFYMYLMAVILPLLLLMIAFIKDSISKQLGPLRNQNDGEGVV